MKSIKLFLSMMLVASMTLLFLSCGEDEEPETLPPSIAFTDTDAAANSERGGSVDIEVSLLAPGGIQTLTANGTNVTVTPGQTQQTVTFTFEVDDDETLGAKPIEFILTDTKNRTANATYQVTVVGSTFQITENITASTTWTDGNIYVLNEPITVSNNAILTIEPGVTVQAMDDGKALNDATKKIIGLTIEVGSRIEAVGTATRPISFTVKPTGTAAPMPGMWAGLYLRGDAADANYNAGTLKYVRVEYGGATLTPGATVTSASDPRFGFLQSRGAINLINIGLATTLEYVQTFKSWGEGFRFEGSNAKMKWCVGTDNLQATLNTRTTGTSAAPVFTKLFVQYFISNTSASFGDGIPSALTDKDKSSRDLLMTQAPTGTAAAAGNSTLTLSNTTFLGPGYDFTVGGAQSTCDASRIEGRNNQLLLYNSILAEFPDDGIRMDNNIATTGSVVDNNYLFRIKGPKDQGDLASGVQTIVAPSHGSSFGATILRNNAVVFATAPYVNNLNVTSTGIAGIGMNDFTPNASQASAFNPTTLNSASFAFESAPFVGAISTADWTTGWVKNPNGTIR